MRYIIVVTYAVAMLGSQCRGDADNLKYMLYNFSRLSNYMDTMQGNMNRLRPLMDGPPDPRAENFYAVLNANMKRVDRYWNLYLREINRNDGLYTALEQIKLVSAFKDLTRKREALSAFMDKRKVLLERKRLREQEELLLQKLYAMQSTTPSVSVNAV